MGIFLGLEIAELLTNHDDDEMQSGSKTGQIFICKKICRDFF